MLRLPDLPKLPRFPQPPESPRLPGTEPRSPLPGAPGQPSGLPDAAPSLTGRPFFRAPADRRGHPVRWDNREAERRVEGNSGTGARRGEEDAHGQGAENEREARQPGGEQPKPHPREEQPGGRRAEEQEKQEERAAKQDQHRQGTGRQGTAHQEHAPRERRGEQPPGHGEGDRRQDRQQERRTDPPNHRAALRPPASFGNVTAPRPSGQAIGKHDLYAADDASPQRDEPRRGRLAAQPSGQVLPVLPLGTGLTLMGLGLAFLALRVRRGA
ncbi:hypothetical protein [Streptomyces sp. NPDC007083]|uniref:hypothetical protein n=1 Tax=unclassified Streptomyces TaxID=2593676 RepID=UPI0033DA662F